MIPPVSRRDRERDSNGAAAERQEARRVQVTRSKETTYTNAAVAVSRMLGNDGSPIWRVHFVTEAEILTFVLPAELRDALLRDLSGGVIPAAALP